MEQHMLVVVRVRVRREVGRCGRRAQPGLIMAAQLVSWLAGLMSVRQITDVASLAQRSSQQ